MRFEPRADRPIGSQRSAINYKYRGLIAATAILVTLLIDGFSYESARSARTSGSAPRTPVSQSTTANSAAVLLPNSTATSK